MSKCPQVEIVELKLKIENLDLLVKLQARELEYAMKETDVDEDTLNQISTNFYHLKRILINDKRVTAAPPTMSSINTYLNNISKLLAVTSRIL